MKNFLIVLNVVLVIAVGVLFYLHFAGRKPVAYAPAVPDTATPASFKIVYFDIDSLETQYEYYKQSLEYIRNKENQITGQLNVMRDNFNNKLKEYQQKGASMSQTEQTAAQQDLARMQNEFRDADQRKHEELQGESMRRLQEVKVKIQNFLKDYSKSHGYIFVYASADNDNLYYKDTSRNITSEIARILNEQYRAEKKSK